MVIRDLPMKKTRFLPCLLLPLLSGCYSSTSIGTYADADKYLSGNQSYDSKISRIDVDWICGKLTLVSDQSIAGAKLEEENEFPTEEKVHSYLKDEQLNVKFFASGHRSYNLDPKGKELVLTYNPNYISELNIGLTSGTLVAPKLTASSKVDIALTSGVANVEGITAPTFEGSFTSGSLFVKELSADKAKISGTSGTIDVSNIKASEFHSSITSGHQNLRFISFATSNVSMTSGETTVKLPDEGGILTIDKSRTGSLTINRANNSDGSRYVFGESKSTMAIDFTSGKLTIE